MAHQKNTVFPVPYVAKLGKKLEPGQTLEIHGTIGSDPSEFEVNLLTDSPNIETATATILHVKARFKDNKLVFNTYENGKWGKEEKSSNPFKKDEKFDLRIRVHPDKFEIYGNQKALHVYKAHVNINAEYLAVRGDVSLHAVQWGGQFYHLPFETYFEHGSLKSGGQLKITGIPKGDRFEVNFLSNQGDILFHFNPRFSEKQVVRNSRINNVWGDEEREGLFPFTKDVITDLVFHNEPFSLQIYADAKHYVTYAHRTPKPEEDYKGFRIGGDFELTRIEFIN
ncbi:unnamed protein product [Thelazia callipaeda]|uniref:Galectin n=1 Tax=Thelazia callipaeda TaxID=103827 RepID=A0A0N5CN94_THECL|nr:unnamed protein product [Thelazia callipaeda]